MHEMTVREVAERLKVSKSFVCRRLVSGRLKHFLLGGARGGKRANGAHLVDRLRLPLGRSTEAARPRGSEAHAPLTRLAAARRWSCRWSRCA